MNARPIVALVIASVSLFARPASAKDMPVKDSATALWMIEQARAWADQACGGKWVISELFAEDFKGTSPKGARYEKPTGEPPYDPKTQWSTNCSLDTADVRFFGSDVAVMYGAESKTVTLADGKQERRCLVWTDTWLRRNGKWQIIAVQDNRTDCPVK
ncbi:MAG: nuclear transport factor 2 family protein [Steroidobacteraceae bacterium]